MIYFTWLPCIFRKLCFCSDPAKPNLKIIIKSNCKSSCCIKVENVEEPQEQFYTPKA